MATCAVGIFVLAACNHEPDHTTETPRTTGGSQELASPVDSHFSDDVARARCDREQTCNNVGVGKTYATRDVCVEKFRADTSNDFTKSSCPNGLSRPALEKCMADIRGERCDNPLDTISRLSACSKSSLCP
jgi:hypothetical protein